MSYEFEFSLISVEYMPVANVTPGVDTICTVFGYGFDGVNTVLLQKGYVQVADSSNQGIVNHTYFMNFIYNHVSNFRMQWLSIL